MLIREISLDTETTGLSYINGDKIIEIGCVEIIDKIITGKTFHSYLNTNKNISLSAFNIHGINNQFLQGKPWFHDIAGHLIDFISNSKIIIHNANFDLGFINNELSHTSYSKICTSQVIDTLTLARKMYPGHSVSLDALCKKFSINLQARNKHGALIDAKLLALAYIEMTRAKQSHINFEYTGAQTSLNKIYKNHTFNRNVKLTKQENKLYTALLSKLDKKS